MPDRDPWTWWAHPELANARRMVWRDPVRRQTVIMWGAVAELNWDGCTPWSEYSTSVRRILSQGHGDAEHPLAWAGMAFDRRGGEGWWSGWPATRVVVPVGLIVNDSKGTRAVLHGRPEDRAEIELDRLAIALAEPSRAPVGATAGWTVDPCEADSAWCARVEDAQAAMARAEFDKVVLATAVRYRSADGRPPSAIGTANTLRKRNPDAFCFGVSADEQHFVGASPELLVAVCRGELRTQALAGTTARGVTAAQDALLARELLDNAKERLEHRMVVDGIRSALEPLCDRLQAANGPQIVSLPAVQHLSTPVRATLRPHCDVFDALDALHPTAAVGGAPRREAQTWLRTEPFPRGWFASPVGVLDGAGGGTFAVAIRSVLIGANDAVAQAGAGILPASDPLGEWDEVQLKLRTSASALAVEP